MEARPTIQGIEMNIPNGAQTVIDARKRGFKPAEMLIISLIGPTNEANHTIHASPKGEYDWRWLVGLDACIFVNGQTDWKAITRRIAASGAHWLGLYDVDRFQGADVWYLPAVEDIAKPRSHWRYKMSFLPWLLVENQEFAWSE